MGLTRREFIKLCMASTAGVSMMSWLGPELKNIAHASDGKPPVIWLQAASCTGCSISCLNTVEPDIGAVLLDVISMRYHPNIMAGQGELCGEIIDDVANSHHGKFVLVVEGGIPLKENGGYCTIMEKGHKELTVLEAVRTLSMSAAAVIAAGNCASFGGIPAAAPNPTGVVPVSEVVKRAPVINLSLCPLHPDHLLGTIVHLLQYGLPDLDRYKRPKMFYPGPIHDSCPRREDFHNNVFAQFIGDDGCLAMLGCKGFIATSDCSKRLWNNSTNWCIDAGAPCHACSEPIYPDGCSPFYGLYPLNAKDKSKVTYPVVDPQVTEFISK
ncbi:MAG: hydrogenase small subunit [Peptococcaceae bacterium]|nr:hydrogenase small subunit [Peptococcaceae bacterium]